MTDEAIRRMASGAWRSAHLDSNVNHVIDHIAGAIREAVLQAYEEAIKIADTPDLQGDWDRLEPMIANEIRKLAEPLKAVQQ
jgi:hypothetical protein